MEVGIHGRLETSFHLDITCTTELMSTNAKPRDALISEHISRAQSINVSKVFVCCHKQRLMFHSISLCSVRVIAVMFSNWALTWRGGGAHGGAVGCGTAPEAGKSRVRFLVMSLEFFMDMILSGRGTREIKFRIAMAKAAFNNKKTFLGSWFRAS
jgi:hypothetical protein